MKVLQILTDTNIGGAGIWLLNFLRAYDRDRLELAVVLPKNAALKARVEELGVRVIEAEKIADRSFSVGGILSLKEIIQKEEPDLIHTHASISARIAGRLQGVKIVHTRHCLEEPKRFIKRFLYRLINNGLSDAVIGVSDAVAENLIADGISKEKVYRVYNGIRPLSVISPEKKAALRRQYGIEAQDVVLGIVARLEPVKNHALFLEAAKFAGMVNPRLKFLIVGDGSLTKELKAQAKKTEIADRIIFTGYIRDVNDIMNIIDIPVLTSHKEALSLSLAMIDLGQNERKRAEFGAAGKQIVREKFSIDEMAQKIEAIYIEIKGKDERNEDDRQ